MVPHKFVCVVLVSFSMAAYVQAGVGSKVVQEALEFTTRKFGKEVAESGAERLASKMTSLAARHGDDVVSLAFKKVGPRTSRIVSEAGEQGDVVLRLLAKHGDDALPAASRLTSLKLISSYGDDAADAIVRHGSVGESVIGQFAGSGAKALSQVTPQNGRRLAMMAGQGELTVPVLEVVAKYGDRAAEFVWNNKGALAVGAALTAFVASPDDFIDGTVDLTNIVAENAVKPLAEVPKVVLAEAAHAMNWMLIGTLTGITGMLGLVIWRDPGLRRSTVRLWKTCCLGFQALKGTRSK